MTSLASTNGPSTTLSCPPLMRTCAPVASGIRPPLSSIRPALISRSASLCIASRSAGGGGPAWADVTINMNRLWEFLLRRAAAPSPLNCLAHWVDEPDPGGSTSISFKIVPGSENDAPANRRAARDSIRGVGNGLNHRPLPLLLRPLPFEPGLCCSRRHRCGVRRRRRQPEPDDAGGLAQYLHRHGRRRRGLRGHHAPGHHTVRDDQLDGTDATKSNQRDFVRLRGLLYTGLHRHASAGDLD